MAPFGEPHFGERAAGDPATLGDAQLDHLGPAREQRHIYDLALANEAEDGLGGEHPWRDGHVHAEGVGERRELALADTGDGNAGPELAGVHSREKVGPVVSGDGHEGVGAVTPSCSKKSREIPSSWSTKPFLSWEAT